MTITMMMYQLHLWCNQQLHLEIFDYKEETQNNYTCHDPTYRKNKIRNEITRKHAELANLPRSASTDFT
jgi:hypothetical protein